MAARLRPLRRLVYIYFRCLGQQMKAILAYEADFVILMISAGIVQISGFLFIWTVFARIPNINGWTFWQVVMMYSLIFITEAWARSSSRHLAAVAAGLHRRIRSDAAASGVAHRSGSGRRGRLQRPWQHNHRRHALAVSLGNVNVAWTPGRALMLVILVASAATIRVAINLGTSATAFWIRAPWSMVPFFVHQLGEFAKYR